MFSSRLPATLAPNLVSQAVAALRQSGAPLLDLTETNPTVVGLPYPADVLASLADPRARVYAPDPLGLAEARAAVAAEYASRAAIAPDRIVLTASTQRSLRDAVQAALRSGRRRCSCRSRAIRCSSC